MRDALDTDWSLAATAARRDRFLRGIAAEVRRRFRDPMASRRDRCSISGMPKAADIDLLGMNVCISVGHSHPTVVAAAMKQAQELTHCTKMFYHPGAGASPPRTGSHHAGWSRVGRAFHQFGVRGDRSRNGNGENLHRQLDLLAPRTAYHGPTSAAQSLTGIAGFRHPGMPGNVAFVAEPNQYRGIFGPWTEPYLDEIDRVIATATTGRVAGIFVKRPGLRRNRGNAEGLHVRRGRTCARGRGALCGG